MPFDFWWTAKNNNSVSVIGKQLAEPIFYHKVTSLTSFFFSTLSSPHIWLQRTAGTPGLKSHSAFFINTTSCVVISRWMAFTHQALSLVSAVFSNGRVEKEAMSLHHPPNAPPPRSVYTTRVSSYKKNERPTVWKIFPSSCQLDGPPTAGGPPPWARPLILWGRRKD